MDSIYKEKVYIIEHQQVSYNESEIWIYNNEDKLLLYCTKNNHGNNKDIRVYADESKYEELLIISLRQLSDTNTYDVYDVKEKKRIGELKSQIEESLLVYNMYNDNNQLIGTIKENNEGLNCIRKHVSLMPQSFEMKVCDERIATIKQSLNPFLDRLSVDFSKKPHLGIDKRIPIATCIVASIN